MFFLDPGIQAGHHSDRRRPWGVCPAGHDISLVAAAHGMMDPSATAWGGLARWLMIFPSQHPTQHHDT
jgi:hypothetical protein